MGKIRNSGLGFCSGSSPQGHLMQSSVDAKIEELIKGMKAESEDARAKMLSLLERVDVKFNPDDVIFVTTDKTGQLVWLEKGNEEAGLKHIEKHAGDFAKKHGTPPNELTNHTKRILADGEVVSSKKNLLANGKIGLEKNPLLRGQILCLSSNRNEWVYSLDIPA